jgi:hypothetical protein
MFLDYSQGWSGRGGIEVAFWSLGATTKEGPFYFTDFAVKSPHRAYELTGFLVDRDKGIVLV